MRLRHRCRAVVAGPGRTGRRGRWSWPSSGRLAGVADRPLERIGPRTPAPRDHVRLAEEPPGLREPEVDRRSARARGSRASATRRSSSAASVGLGVRALPLELDRRAELRPPVACSPCGRDRLVEQRVGAVPLARAHRRAPELGQERAAVGVLRWQQREGALEHHHRGGEVLAPERAPRRRSRGAHPPRRRGRASVRRRPGRARRGSDRPARGGRRGSRRARRSPVPREPAPGATARSARGARRARPSGCPRTSRRRSASAGSGRRPRRAARRARA